MKLPRRTLLHLAAGVVALPAVSRIANAQTYPARPVKLIVPYAQEGQPMSAPVSLRRNCQNISVSSSMSRISVAPAATSAPVRPRRPLPTVTRS